MSVVEKNAVVEGKTARIERTQYDGGSSYEFSAERSRDGFIGEATKHFEPKSVEIESLPDAIGKNAVKGDGGQSLGIMLGAGVLMERSLVYHGQGPATTRTIDNQTYVDFPTRITTELYVPLKDIDGMEGTLQIKRLVASEFEKKVEVAPF